MLGAEVNLVEATKEDNTLANIVAKALECVSYNGEADQILLKGFFEYASCAEYAQNGEYAEL